MSGEAVCFNPLILFYFCSLSRNCCLFTTWGDPKYTVRLK